MSDDRVMLSGRVPEQLKRLVDADERDNQDVIEAALWREFGGERLAPLERRIEEKERRVSLLQSERNERQRELDQEKEQLEALRRKKEEMEEREKQQKDAIQNAVNELLESKVDLDPENAAVKHQAREIDLTAEELAERAREERGGAL